jgi:hypothetical protein
MKHQIMAALTAACLILPMAAQAADEAPDATMTLSGGAIAAGIGYSWGNGTLNFDGKPYKIKVSGLNVGDIGAATIHATGDVYHLKNVVDFNGTYAAAGAGAALVGGGSIVTLQNGQGVVIQLRTQENGVRLTLSASAINLTVVP